MTTTNMKTARAVSLQLVLAIAGFAGLPVGILHAQTLTGTRSAAFEYDSSTGMLSAEIVEPDSGRADYCVRTSYARDSFGNVTGTTVANCAGASSLAQFTARSSTTVFAAHSVAIPGVGTLPVPAGAFVTQVTNALGQSEAHKYDVRFGQIVAQTGPNGLSSALVLDDFGRKVLETRIDGNMTIWRHCLLPAKVTDASSNSAGCATPGTAPAHAVSYVEEQPIDSTGAINGPYARKYADAKGREIRVETQGYDGPNQSADSRIVIKDTHYNAWGLTAQTTVPYFAATGGARVGGTSHGWTNTLYDALGQPSRLQERDDGAPVVGDNRYAETTYGVGVMSKAVTRSRALPPYGFPVIEQSNTLIENAVGETIQSIDTLGATVTIKRDAFGNAVETRDALDNRITASYDVRGRRTQLTDPNAGTWNYRYNALGELVAQQSPLQLAGTATISTNSWTTMTYDVLGRLTRRSEPEYVTNWHYDKYADNSPCAKGIGKVCEITTSHGVTKRAVFDSLGRLSTSTHSITSGPTFVTVNTYDSHGRLSTSRYPSGVTLSYAYTSLGYQSQISQVGASGYLWQLEYATASGAAELVKTANGTQVTEIARYATTGRTHNIRSGTSVSTLGNIVNQAYEWDVLGNLTSRSELYDTASGGLSVGEAFTYDRRNRLTAYSVTSPGISGLNREVRLEYDVIGNITYKSDVGRYVYPASGLGSIRPGAVTSITRGTLTESFSYDVAGNVVAAVNAKYASVGYTSFNLADGTSGVLGANGTRYTWQYGPEHERVKEVKVSAGVTRTTWYHHPDNANGLSFEQETVGSTTINRHYVSAGGQAFLVMDSNNTAPTTITGRQWWHRDHLGSIAAITNDAGVVSQRMSYDPFGKRREIDGTYDEFGTLVYDYAGATDRGFTGHEHMDDVGIVNMNGRMYDPTMARMMSADPVIQNADDLQNYNRYSYLTNNPLNSTDPTGHFKFKKLFKAVVTVVIAIYAPQLLLEYGIGSGVSYGVVATMYAPGVTAVAHAAAGGLAALVASNGDPNAAIKGAITAGAFSIVGSTWNAGTNASYAGHAAVGCLDGMMGGNGCGRGAASAYVGKFATVQTEKLGAVQRLVAASIAGGAASAVGGGKFENGAATAAFGYIFNECGHTKCFGGSYGPGPEDHYYVQWTKLNDNCVGDCFQKLLTASPYFSAPGYGLQPVPFEDGGVRTVFVRMPFLPETPGSYTMPIGRVQQTLQGDGSITNTTMPDHFACCGTVNRTLMHVNQSAYMLTIGQGTNWFGLLKQVNEDMGPKAFRQLDNQLRRAAK